METLIIDSFSEKIRCLICEDKHVTYFVFVKHLKSRIHKQNLFDKRIISNIVGLNNPKNYVIFDDHVEISIPIKIKKNSHSINNNHHFTDGYYKQNNHDGINCQELNMIKETNITINNFENVKKLEFKNGDNIFELVNNCVDIISKMDNEMSKLSFQLKEGPEIKFDHYNTVKFDNPHDDKKNYASCIKYIIESNKVKSVTYRSIKMHISENWKNFLKKFNNDKLKSSIFVQTVPSDNSIFQLMKCIENNWNFLFIKFEEFKNDCFVILIRDFTSICNLDNFNLDFNLSKCSLFKSEQYNNFKNVQIYCGSIEKIKLSWVNGESLQ